MSNKSVLKNNLFQFLLVSFIIFLVGCSDNNSNISPTQISLVPTKISGLAVDGYISDATVCIDTNLNQNCDEDEVQTRTKSDGSYTLDADVKKGDNFLIMRGGIDTATNKEFPGILRTVVLVKELESNGTEDTKTQEIRAEITPLTTLYTHVYSIEKEKDSEYLITTAQEEIAVSLGVAVEKIEKDPLQDLELFEVTQQVVQTIRILEETLNANSTDTTNNVTFNSLLNQVAVVLNEGSETSFDSKVLIEHIELERTISNEVKEVISKVVTTITKEVSLLDATQEVAQNLDSLQNSLDSITDLETFTTFEVEQKSVSVESTPVIEEPIKEPLTELIVEENIENDLEVTEDPVVLVEEEVLVEPEKVEEEVKEEIVDTTPVLDTVLEPTPAPTPAPAPDPTPSDITTPIFTNANSITVSENQSSAITLSATDNNTVTFSISGTDASSLTINSTTGVVTFVSAPDFETKLSYTFTATANDGKNSAHLEVTITISDVDEIAPVFTSESNVTVEENQKSAISLHATDTSSLTYSINGDDAVLFVVNTTTGVVSFIDFPDFETKNSYTFTAVANDSFQQSNQTVIITISDMNETFPIFTNESNVSVDENNITAFIITAATETPSIRYDINGTDLSSFDINKSTGVVTFKTIPDFETKKLYILNAIAYDENNNSSEQNMTINIINLNDIAPIFISDNNATVNENQTSVITLVVSDEDNLTAPLFSINGSDASNFSVDSNSGVITFNSAPDFETKAEYSFSATADDGVQQTLQNITIMINNLNDVAPLITSVSTISVDENQLSILTLTATDEDNLSDSNFTISGVDVTSFVLDSNSSVLTFNSAPDFEIKSEYNITITATDSINTSEQNLFIMINNLNDNTPTFTSLNSITVNEKQTSAITLTASDADNLVALSYGLSGSDASSFDLNTSTGVVTFKVAPDFDAKSSFSFVANVSDSENNDTQSVTINLIKVQEIIELCDRKNLKFDTLISTTNMVVWAEGAEGEINSSKVVWYPFTNADHYEMDLTVGSTTFSGIDTFDANVILFKNDPAVNGVSFFTQDGFLVCVSSSFTLNKSITVNVRAKDSSNNTLQTSAAHTFSIGKTYLSTAPQNLWSQINSQSVNLEWCGTDGATSFKLDYGTSQSSLDQTITTANATTLAQTIGSLNNDESHFFSIAAINVNGVGKYSETTQATPSDSNNSVDFSINKVTFNQSVQIDLQNNSNSTPSIAGKPGVLRVFIDATSNLIEHQKVQVQLNGSKNGVALESIIKVFSLSDSPFTTSDSTNLPLFFDINDSNWMDENTSFSLQIDPNNVISETDETNNRYPSSNEQSFGFEQRFKMRVKLVPVTTAVGAVTISNEIVTGLKSYLESIFPLHEVEVTVGAIQSSLSSTPTDDGNIWGDILDDVKAYKAVEVANDSTNADVFYYGVIDKSGTSLSGLQGLAFVNPVTNFDGNELSNNPDLVGLGRIDEISALSFYRTTAHELGHNHGRDHISNSNETNEQCGTPASPDQNFPYNSTGLEFGRIGKTGYNHLEKSLYEKTYYHDLMGYCTRVWISDYTYKAINEFEKKLDVRYSRSGNVNAFIAQAPSITGRTITGKIIVDNSGNNEFKLRLNYIISGSSEVPQFSSDYYAVVVLKNLQRFEIPIRINSLDHSDVKRFSFFIPSSSEIETIVIENRLQGIAYKLF